MHLDSNTLIFSISILSLLMALISWTFPSTITDRDFGLKHWAVGICFVGFSLSLTFMRSQLHYFFGVVLSSGFLLAGGTLGLVAPSIFFRVPIAYRRVIVALLMGFGGLFVHTVLGYSIAFAMVGVCFGMSILLVSAGLLVFKQARRPLAMPARIFAWSMGLMGVAYWVRAALVAWNPNVGVAPVSLAGGHQSMLIWGAIFVVASTIGFYSMVHDEQKHEIAERAKRDPLTGLFNRRAFFELTTEVERAKEDFSILMIDIDHFKSINDTYGHLGGDVVLSHAGRLIQNFFRIDDIACRFGGEEFCVLIRNCNAVSAMERAHTLVREFHQRNISLADGRTLTMTISVGVSQRVLTVPLLKTLQQADDALYRAKSQGRNQAQLADALPAPPPVLVPAIA
jgi:diguanylate cyclase (GGDEF)-like protein